MTVSPLERVPERIAQQVVDAPAEQFTEAPEISMWNPRPHPAGIQCGDQSSIAADAWRVGQSAYPNRVWKDVGRVLEAALERVAEQFSDVPVSAALMEEIIVEMEVSADGKLSRTTAATDCRTSWRRIREARSSKTCDTGGGCSRGAAHRPHPVANY